MAQSLPWTHSPLHAGGGHRDTGTQLHQLDSVISRRNPESLPLGIPTQGPSLSEGSYMRRLFHHFMASSSQEPLYIQGAALPVSAQITVMTWISRQVQEGFAHGGF